MVFNNLGANVGKVSPSRKPFKLILLQHDLNFELRVLPPGGLSVIFQGSWLLNEDTAKGINVGPGLLADPSHSIIVLPGLEPGQPRQLTPRAWKGNYDMFEEAENAGAGVG